MDTQSLSEEVGTILRSILTSEKLGIPLRLLDGEYRTLTGSHIPYQKLGFNTLEAYLRSVPDVAKLNSGRHTGDQYHSSMLATVLTTFSRP